MRTVAGIVVGALWIACTPPSGDGPDVIEPLAHDVSPPLRELTATASPAVAHSARRLPRPESAGPEAVSAPLALATALPAPLANFEGLGAGFSGFSVSSAPPDPDGAVGPNHYVEVVNSSFVVFDKTGVVVFGPVATNALWAGFSGGCQTNNDGDATVRYDHIADRWVFSQFSVSTTPYLECIAVSTSPDPTGSYNRYAFSFGNFDFPDYPKIALWPDAYYATYNIFSNASSFNGARVCAMDRAKMLAGQPATQICFNTTTDYGGVLVGDVDGATQPPAGSPAYVLGLGADTTSLAYWKFHADFATPAASTFTGPTSIVVPPYTPMCGGQPSCVPQPGTTNKLEGLDDRLMNRLVYRNYGTHEALFATHAVAAGTSGGMRWYEVRVATANNLSLFQAGTYAPDANWRWMGSIAADQQGNVALGFSLSSSSIKPAIHYTARLADDAAGTMSQGEGTIINGGGVQSGTHFLTRWGDYTSMNIDPSDDCTFWYVNQYQAVNGEFNWSTRIGAFKLPSCEATVTNDFSMSASPNAASVLQGGNATSTISTVVTSGSAESVAFSIAGLPAGASASFGPASVTAGGSSTLTVVAGASTPPGTYTLAITGTAASALHSVAFDLTVGAVSNDFWISSSPNTISLVQGGNATSTISTAVTSGSAESVALAIAGLPVGASASFSPASVTAGQSATLTIVAGAATPPGTYSLAITGSAASAMHSTAVDLTVTVPVPDDFSISASPSNVSVLQGGSANTTITTAVISGSAETLALSASGLPVGASASFSSGSITTGGSVTLTLSASATTPAGTYAVVVTATGATATHTTSVSFTVVNVADDFSVSASAGSLSAAPKTVVSTTISTAVTSGAAQSLTLSVTGLPHGTTATFGPNPIVSGASSVLSIAVAAGTHAGTYVLNVTASGASATHTTSVTLTVTKK